MIGRTLKHYKVESQLGKGGMGTVYRAVDTRLQRPVALKVLNDDLTSDPDRKRRFFQEARAAAAINHPAVAQVYDVDEADSVTFIAMEFVEGQTVRQLIDERDLDVLAAVEIAIQAAEGIAKAHEIGVVHRDIKSENIMVTRDGHVKILDFGLAKLAPMHNVPSGGGAEDHMSQMATLAQTQAGMVVGTVAYMSPEQARGRPVDHRSDIFSLGATIYEMATGRLPFGGDSPLDTMHAIAFEETRPVTEFRQNIPPGLQKIVARCLRKRVEDRYQDARALAEDLKELKLEIDSGITRGVPLHERLRDRFGSLKVLRDRPALLTTAGVILAVAALGILVWTGKFWSVFFVGLGGWWIYRKLSTRRQRLARRFAAKVGRFPEVRLISFRDNKATVIVDQIHAKTHLRVNSLMESVNGKFHLGGPMTAVVRDNVPDDELRRILQEPGVLYLRDDVALDAPRPTAAKG